MPYSRKTRNSNANHKGVTTMVSLIVAAHDKLAPALMGTATMILGPTEGVTTVTFMPG